MRKACQGITVSTESQTLQLKKDVISDFSRTIVSQMVVFRQYLFVTEKIMVKCSLSGRDFLKYNKFLMKRNTWLHSWYFQSIFIRYIVKRWHLSTLITFVLNTFQSEKNGRHKMDLKMLTKIYERWKNWLMVRDLWSR